MLAKYGPNAYKVELTKEMSISPIFNMNNLIKYKGPEMKDEQYNTEVNRDVEELKVPDQIKPQVEKILDSRVKKKTRHKLYMEHLVKWRHQPKLEAT